MSLKVQVVGSSDAGATMFRKEMEMKEYFRD